MTPSDRIHHIRNIASELSNEEWSLIDLTLKEFDLPWQDGWNGVDKCDYVMEMISSVRDQSLLDLAQHLGLASSLSVVEEPAFWSDQEPRVFLTHLTKHKKFTSALSDLLKNKYGVIGFVAHEDISPTHQWQNEIEAALSTMDALVALMTPKFINSCWCDQEIGVAIGRNLPIIAIKFEQDPYGFIGKYQALQGMKKKPAQLARELVELFLPMPGIGSKITNALVKKFSESSSFDESKNLAELIKTSNYLNKKLVDSMKQAAKSNMQISHSWGVIDIIKELIKKHES